MQQLPHVKQDPNQVGLGIYFVVVLIGIGLLVAALICYERGNTVMATILCVLGGVGVSVSEAPFTAWANKRKGSQSASEK